MICRRGKLWCTRRCGRWPLATSTHSCREWRVGLRLHSSSTRTDFSIGPAIACSTVSLRLVGRSRRRWSCGSAPPVSSRPPGNPLSATRSCYSATVPCSGRHRIATFSLHLLAVTTSCSIGGGATSACSFFLRPQRERWPRYGLAGLQPSVSPVIWSSAASRLRALSVSWLGEKWRVRWRTKSRIRSPRSDWEFSTCVGRAATRDRISMRC